MKKILVIHPSSNLYSSGKILINSLQSMPKELLKIVLLPEDGPLIFRLRSEIENIEIVVLKELPLFNRSALSIRSLFRLVKNYNLFKEVIINLHRMHDFSMVYHSTLETILLLRITKKMGLKSLVHCHHNITSPWLMAKIINKQAFILSDKLLCASYAIKNNFLDFKSSFNKVHMIHNGVDEVMARRNLIDKSVVFLMVGRISRKKGHWYLMEALSQLPKHVLREVKVYIVGGPDEGKEYVKKELRAAIAKYKLQSNVALLPFTEDLTSVMSKSNVILVPSLKSESIPSLVAKAMSASRPVIATNHGGAKEVILDGWNGKLVCPFESKSLAEAIQQYVENPHDIVEHGSRGKHMYLKSLTTAIFHKSLTDFYADKYDIGSGDLGISEVA
jgi:glycosyltransferase involved in cell wall biosynthesis